MPHIKFQLSQTFGYVAVKNFKMAIISANRHLGYQKETILAFLNLNVAPIPSMKFRLNPTFCLGGDVSFEEFQDDHHGGYLGYHDGTILSILTLHAAPNSPMKPRLNPFFCSGDVVWRISRWPPWWPSLISGQNDFSHSESPCHTDASNQVSARSDFWFGRKCHLMNFKMATIAAISDIRTLPNNSKSPCCLDISLQVSAQSNLQFWRSSRKCETLTTDGRTTDGQTDDGPQATA